MKYSFKRLGLLNSFDKQVIRAIESILEYSINIDCTVAIDEVYSGCIGFSPDNDDEEAFTFAVDGGITCHDCKTIDGSNYDIIIMAVMLILAHMQDRVTLCVESSFNMNTYFKALKLMDKAGLLMTSNDILNHEAEVIAKFKII